MEMFIYPASQIEQLKYTRIVKDSSELIKSKTMMAPKWLQKERGIDR